MTSLDANAQTLRLWGAVLGEAAAHLARTGAHPARAVLLLPYAQLMPLATRLWTRLHPNGFAPRFETTRNWAQRLRAFSPGADDLSLDPGRDLLTAQTLLARAGLEAQRDTLAPALVDAALQLVPRVAAVAPAGRTDWLLAAQQQLAPTLELGALALESGLTQIALAWAATSSYATDALHDDWVPGTVDALVVLQGHAPDPLAQALLARWENLRPGCALALQLPQAALAAVSGEPRLALHAARDAEDEAQRAAACVLQHVAAGRTPVALAAIDRVLTRRVRAMLDTARIAMRDEHGWKLSTTRAGAHVMLALKACAWQPGSDQVLDWLKHSPAQPPALVARLEQHLRRRGQRQWPRQIGGLHDANDADLLAWIDRVNQQRALLGRSRTLPAWLDALRELLQASGQWESLRADAAGLQLLQALRLDTPHAGTLADWRGSDRRLSLEMFTAWVNTVLEAASYQPDYPVEEQVVILPLSQVLARPFAALVAAGCDEVRLPAAPDPAGAWTAGQRELLGLPGREQGAAATLSAWQVALTLPQVDILWRESDTTGEPLLPSPLVQRVRLGAQVEPAAEPRPVRRVPATPQSPPAPVGAALALRQLSASSYDNLRHCPYRFFALNQLALRDSEELDDELDKRDFGQWLHAVLRQFHEGLRDRPSDAWAEWQRRIDAAAAAVTAAMHLDEGDFLPFASTWPRLRDGYLAWFQDWQAQGLRFDRAELGCEQPMGGLQLVGRLDRVDIAPASPDSAVLLDYKTESLAKTRERVKYPTEDTQLAFYAAIWPSGEAPSLRAAYLNLSDKDGSKLVELPGLETVRALLLQGVADDMTRIAAGHPLPALGQAPLCDYCDARGLCRKDFWT